MKNEQNAPQVRFKGFTDAWEQRELRTAATFSKGSGYSKNDLRESGTPIILYGRLYTKYETVINDVDTFVEETPNSVYSTGHEVIVPASGETAEDISRASFVAKSGILLGGDLNIITPADYINPVFLALTISNGNQQKELSKRAQGKSVVHIHNSDLENVVLLYPTYEEQKRIGAYFSKLDSIITLHQRKCETLQKLKKSMLQKMFPKNGNLYPEIRFAGFTNAWEQRECGEILIERNIQHPQSKEFPLVSFTVENGVTPKTERYEREQLVRGDKSAKKYKETRLNDIVYNPANLKFGAIARNKYGNAVFSPIYITYEVREELATPSFVEMCVTKNSFIQSALQYQQGTVYERMAVNTEDFATLNISLPMIDEQFKIGAFFARLDQLITLHQRKLETLKKLKKSMLQKMFI